MIVVAVVLAVVAGRGDVAVGARVPEAVLRAVAVFN